MVLRSAIFLLHSATTMLNPAAEVLPLCCNITAAMVSLFLTNMLE
jgi:hypothetical protein